MNTDLLSLLSIGSRDWAALGFTFMLVLARTAAATMMLPAIGESAAPAMVRAGFALCLTVLIVPTLPVQAAGVSETSIEACAYVVAEVTTGLTLGWLARVWVQSLAVAAQFIAYLLGISSVLQPDADLGPQSTALAHLFDLAGPVIILTSGLFMLPIRALAGSYVMIPPGRFLSAGFLAQSGLRSVEGAFTLALQLAAPFVVASVVWHVAIGLLSRLVPKLQVYFVAMPGQIIGGLLLLSLSASVILGGWYSGVQAELMRGLPG